MKPLHCTGYDVRRRPDEVVSISATFVLPISPHRIDEIAQALSMIELYLAEEINIVKSDGAAARCFYCATKASEDDKNCTQCGASL